MKITDVLHHFVSYYQKNPLWGPLHIILDDGNVEDKFIIYCSQEAEDRDTKFLCRLLMRMTKTQRKKLPYKVHEIIPR